MLVTGGVVASVRRDLGCVGDALEPAPEGTGVAPEELQPELGPPPEDVFGRARELFPDEVLNLALVKLRQQLAAQVLARAGGAERLLAAGAVGVGTAQAQPRREPGVAPLDRAQEHGEAALRQLAPREPRPRRPRGTAHAESRGEPAP